MPKSPYVKTEQVNVRLPIGLYEEMIRIMDKEKKWNSPQQFIQDALNEKIDRWKKEHAVG
jgi:UTP:GlnB (protein PII) uridylyltransferase